MNPDDIAKMTPEELDKVRLEQAAWIRKLGPNQIAKLESLREVIMDADCCERCPGVFFKNKVGNITQWTAIFQKVEER